MLSPVPAVKGWLQAGATRIFGQSPGDKLTASASGRLRKLTFQVTASYRPAPYPGKVTPLTCSDGPFRAYEDRHLAWSSVAEGGLEVHVVPGNHSTMEKELNIQMLGEEFQRCFDRLADERRNPALFAGDIGTTKRYSSDQLRPDMRAADIP